MQRIWLLNGNNITYDKDNTALHLAISKKWVIEWFGISGSGASAEILPWKAFVECLRANGEKMMVFFESTENVPVDMSGTKKVYILVNQSKIDDGSQNAEDGTGVASITTNPSAYPSLNFVELYSVTTGTPTDDRSFVQSFDGIETLIGDLQDQLDANVLRMDWIDTTIWGIQDEIDTIVWLVQPPSFMVDDAILWENINVDDDLTWVCFIWKHTETVVTWANTTLNVWSTNYAVFNCWYRLTNNIIPKWIISWFSKIGSPSTLITIRFYWLKNKFFRFYLTEAQLIWATIDLAQLYFDKYHEWPIGNGWVSASIECETVSGTAYYTAQITSASVYADKTAVSGSASGSSSAPTTINSYTAGAWDDLTLLTWVDTTVLVSWSAWGTFYITVNGVTIDWTSVNLLTTTTTIALTWLRIPVKTWDIVACIVLVSWSTSRTITYWAITYHLSWNSKPNLTIWDGLETNKFFKSCSDFTEYNKVYGMLSITWVKDDLRKIIIDWLFAQDSAIIDSKYYIASQYTILPTEIETIYDTTTINTATWSSSQALVRTILAPTWWWYITKATALVMNTNTSYSIITRAVLISKYWVIVDTFDVSVSLWGVWTFTMITIDIWKYINEWDQIFFYLTNSWWSTVVASFKDPRVYIKQFTATRGKFSTTNGGGKLIGKWVRSNKINLLFRTVQNNADVV